MKLVEMKSLEASLKPLHTPVLLEAFLKAVSPISGVWVDGTFGAGGYSVALLNAGADQVIAIDRDPETFSRAQDWIAELGDRMTIHHGPFSDMGRFAQQVDGVILDLGISSMQIADASRGFSFMQDGPLDMRMSQVGKTAADLIRESSESELADILYQYGDERRSRRIARAIVKQRGVNPIATTGQLTQIIENCLPLSKPHQKHPATRSFQALRIAVNDECGELRRGLAAAERSLNPGGQLAVVTFHSIEDRMVKKFFRSRSKTASNVNRHAPDPKHCSPKFSLRFRKPILPSDEEVKQNPRARSAKLRIAVRRSTPSNPIEPVSLDTSLREKSSL